MTDKPLVTQDKREILLASMGSDLHVFRFGDWYVLAGTSHRAKLALIDKLYPGTGRLLRADMHALAMKQLSKTD